MSQQLSTIQAQIQKEIEKQKENIVASGGRINTNGKEFTLPDGEKVKNNTLTAVILDYRFNNTYYKAIWDGTSSNRPDCSATGKAQDGLKPASDLESPMNTKCDGCPMNDWGSASNGRGGKACQNKVRLALTTPDADATAPIYTLDLTPTALKSFGAYMDAANKNGLLPINLVTEITFDPSSSFPTCRLKAVGKNEAFEVHWNLRERAQQIL